ncbi:MAG: hypothetical protein FJW38_14575 [Acidobacteria bacterium]|nr:hypothetical protein [Acidobacteriota bacterium]
MRHDEVKSFTNWRGLEVTPIHIPEVSSKIETPSDWAETALAFTPSPKQKQVLDDPGHRLILNCARQWGKTTVIAVKALHEAIHNPKTIVMVLSRTRQQAALTIHKVREFAALLDIKRKRFQGREHSVELPNGSAVFAIAHNAATAVGNTVHIAIVDEAAVVHDDVFSAILPSLARTGGKLWLLSTPVGPTGMFYKIWHDESLAHWTRITATVDDIAYADKEVLALETRLFPNRAEQDFYCKFVQPPGRLVDPALLDRLVNPNIEPIDLDRYRKWS